MAYRIRIGEYEILCDSVDEVRALVRPAPQQIQRSDDQHSKNTITERHQPRQQALEQHKQICKLVRSLKDGQRQLIRLLADSVEPVTDETLRVELKLDDNKALAGVLSGISKRTKAAGLEPIIVKTSHRNGSGERQYEYRIAPSLLNEVKAGLV